MPRIYQSFGLDISDLTLRLIQFKKRRDHISLHSFSQIKVPPELITEGEIINIDSVAELIKKLIQSARPHRPLTKAVVASLPERKSFIKVIQLPRVPENEIEGLLKDKLVQEIPLSLKEAYLDWQVIENEKSNSDEIGVAVAATPKIVVDSCVMVLEKAGLTPIALEIESQAIVRSLIEKPNSLQTAVFIIDIGLERSSFIIFDRNSIQFTSSTTSFAGKLMTDLIAQKLKLSYPEAEKAKILCGLDPKRGKGSTRKILLPLVDTLTEKIRETDVFYREHFPAGHDIKVIILTGGGSKTKNLNQVLAMKLDKQVQIGNPLVNISDQKSISDFNKENIASYTTSIGLALREIKEL